MTWDWDLLRLSSAIVAGALLSFSGSLIQITSRNELASPSTLGMDGAAVLAVMAAYLLQTAGLSTLPLGTLAFLVGSGSALIVFLFTGRSSNLGLRDFRVILLLGLGINLLVGSIFAVMQFLAMAFNQEFPEQLWFGRMSTLSPVGWALLGVVAIPVGIFCFQHRRHWKALLLGKDWCYGLGVPVERMTRESIALSFVCTLWVVTHFGVFSFIGLLFPLVLRQMSYFRGEPWREMTAGAIGAGGLFSLLDHACYNLTFHGAEIPVGLPAGVLGAAALVTLLWRRSKKASG
ncbi:MAG: iron chelate uptake ABC transporter family permease subunit [Bacteriovoracia bacterium]